MNLSMSFLCGMSLNVWQCWGWRIRKIKTGDWIAEAKGLLSEVSETAALDAQVLAAHVLGKERTQLVAYPEVVLSPSQLQCLDQRLHQYLSGEALPHILGYWEFFGRRFKLSKDVLIPRPETELLVEHAIGWLKRRCGPQVAAEAGIGSGCISISLALETPDLFIFAADISRQALAVGRENINDYLLQDRICLIQGDLLTAYRGPFDLIVANLPYIPTEELENLAVSRSEPWVALDGGVDGLKILRRMLAGSSGLLAGDGLLLMEIEEKQADSILVHARHGYPHAKIEVLTDLNGKSRLLRVERSSS